MSETNSTILTVNSIEELINLVYRQLGSMGLYYHLSNGEVDIQEIMFNIETPLPTTYPTQVTIKCVYTIDVEVFIEVV